MNEYQRRRAGEHTARTPENLRSIRDLTRDGWSANRIALHLGISARVVSRARVDMGIGGSFVPDTFVDEMAVARAIDGDRTVRLNPAETARAVRTLTDRGRSASWIARRLGICERTVVRHRSRTQAAA